MIDLVILSEAKDLPFAVDATIFAVVLIAFTFTVAWFAEQAKGFTGTVSCKCGKRQVVGIAPRAHPDFVKLLSANCPACQSAPREGEAHREGEAPAEPRPAPRSNHGDHDAE
jgi:hypothetical protein